MWFRNKEYFEMGFVVLIFLFCLLFLPTYPVIPPVYACSGGGGADVGGETGSPGGIDYTALIDEILEAGTSSQGNKRAVPVRIGNNGKGNLRLGRDIRLRATLARYAKNKGITSYHDKALSNDINHLVKFMDQHATVKEDKPATVNNEDDHKAIIGKTLGDLVTEIILTNPGITPKKALGIACIMYPTRFFNGW